MKIPKIHLQTAAPIVVVLIVLIANIYVWQKAQANSKNYNSLVKVESSIQNILSQSKSTNNQFITENQNKQAINNDKIKTVLPKQEEITELNRQLENYFNSINSISNPIFLESINYGSSKEVEGKKGLYTVPFSIKFTGTDKNFDKTIDYMQSSGDLERQTRLLKLSKINVNWKGKLLEETAVEVFDYQFEGEAYYYSAI